MATQLEARAAELVEAMHRRIQAVPVEEAFGIAAMTQPLRPGSESDSHVLCKGNQHQCQPQFFVPLLGKRFDMVLTGTGDSVIIGHHDGPRALAWSSTMLEGVHPELGRVTVRLEPTESHAGTLMPLSTRAEFPAMNRNTYFFVFEMAALGEIISDRPAIVEAIIDEIPPKGSYVFRNGPLSLHRRGDPKKETVVILEAAVTDVEPERGSAT